MVEDPLILLRRLSEYVKPYPARTLGEMLGCTERTAEHFRRGESWPNARHWRLIVQAFGRDVLSAVFDPEIDDTLARLNREAAQLEARLDENRARRRKAAGDLEGPEERRDAGDHRSPLDRDLFEGPHQ